MKKLLTQERGKQSFNVGSFGSEFQSDGTGGAHGKSNRPVTSMAKKPL